MEDAVSPPLSRRVRWFGEGLPLKGKTPACNSGKMAWGARKTFGKAGGGVLVAAWGQWGSVGKLRWGEAGFPGGDPSLRHWKPARAEVLMIN